ncbi:hypothetical protein PAHAL_9G040700 [Panicum hallii]|jgi:hypothetical protein|uniref:Uncharacterized protein n=1 Tax=Panicum hallii TaxID=206008 RepID=A0A2S3IGZ0_9POAL|nr:hypothetical protein PAHAL_9G040700 [Panicum hallii]
MSRAPLVCLGSYFEAFPTCVHVYWTLSGTVSVWTPVGSHLGGSPDWGWRRGLTFFLLIGLTAAAQIRSNGRKIPKGWTVPRARTARRRATGLVTRTEGKAMVHGLTLSRAWDLLDGPVGLFLRGPQYGRGRFRDCQTCVCQVPGRVSCLPRTSWLAPCHELLAAASFHTQTNFTHKLQPRLCATSAFVPVHASSPTVRTDRNTIPTSYKPSQQLKWRGFKSE